MAMLDSLTLIRIKASKAPGRDGFTAALHGRYVSGIIEW